MDGVTNNSLQGIALSINGLTLYKNLKKDQLILALQKMLLALTGKEASFPELYQNYHEFCGLAIEHHWPDYLADLILEDENPFTETAVKFGPERISHSLKNLAEMDMAVIQKLGGLTSRRVKEEVNKLFVEQKEIWDENLSPDLWPEWENVWDIDSTGSNGDSTTTPSIYPWWDTLRQQARHLLQGTYPAWDVVEFLVKYHQKMGYGPLSNYLAFRWQGKAGQNLGLAGINNPEPVSRAQLIGLERELKIIDENTEYFLSGFAANNIILYGNRGTGKSSAVKSLLSTFSQRGLRLVELAKEDLGDFHQVIRHLSNIPLKFIIFVDDLSFDDNEPEYKALKTILEGSLEARPKNVLIYATSNRRHLIRENFSERQGDEVHARDTIEEKLSLADRFGITVTFPSTDQEGYLKIVEGLAVQRGLHVEPQELRKTALRWEMMHNGRSGRTARQFIDYYEACLRTPECGQ